ncbi:uncharacterized protein [Maniola hyperantus]|uniref:uncharacterized protein n=1 Tax=Aphantopus hyperantus TaxID=2795564 RepID=UPI003749CBA1
MPFCALHERDGALALLRHAAPLPCLPALCTSVTLRWRCCAAAAPFCAVPRRCRAFLRSWRARRRAGGTALRAPLRATVPLVSMVAHWCSVPSRACCSKSSAPFVNVSAHWYCGTMPCASWGNTSAAKPLYELIGCSE